MDNDCLVACYLQNNFFKSKLFDWKIPKFDDVIGLSPNHVFSSNNGHKYSDPWFQKCVFLRYSLIIIAIDIYEMPTIQKKIGPEVLCEIPDVHICGQGFNIHI